MKLDKYIKNVANLHYKQEVNLCGLVKITTEGIKAC